MSQASPSHLRARPKSVRIPEHLLFQIGFVKRRLIALRGGDSLSPPRIPSCILLAFWRGSASLTSCLCCKEARRLCWLLVIACGLLILGCCFWCVGCWFVLGSLLRRGQFVLGWCVDSAFTLGGGSMLGRVESMNVE